ncbi:MAG: hypothetical protein M1321_01555 [Candidatus Marsarchaeota archaeon]|nr:hypothetical protein [Candidatus Marsarchaeota archaeon]
MGYSFNLKMDRSNMAFAQVSDINASYKDLGAVCDAVRYLKAGTALKLVEMIARMDMPIPYRKHNKHMGARSELHGKKGAYPVKAAREVRVAIQNAIANAVNNAMDGDDMIIVHACANKTRIEQRYPSKGSIGWGRGMYGRSATMHSNIEYARVEIGLAYPDAEGLSKNMKYFISRKGSIERIVGRKSKGSATKQQKNSKEAKKEAKKPKMPSEKTPEKASGKTAEVNAKPVVSAQAQKKGGAVSAGERKAEPAKPPAAKEQK